MLLHILPENQSLETTIAKFQNNLTLALTCLVAATWLLWRLCKFGILPLIYPNDPKELPYWIPGNFAIAITSFGRSHYLLDFSSR